MSDSGGASGPPLLLTRIAALVAVGVALGYLLAPVPNVELVTATCFCAGCLLGVGAGVLCSLLIETLFAGFHPMGSSLGLTLVAQCLGMAGAATLGGLFRPVARRLHGLSLAALVTLMGILSTLWFDLLTNLAFPVAAGFSFEQTLASLGLALPFAALHLLSNALVFLLVVLPAIPKLMRIAEQPL
ncbi:MAG: hypothetical protein H6508_04360 [Calditrichaeota bacterium]|nr:hypothetical protein [Calditrichota bacterium]MCB9366400.1 hypothetical protein [Calditrichota bacterium]